MKKHTSLIVLATLLIAALTPTVVFGEKPFAPVPPRLEIEVLDPGVDPNGNPAVRLQDDGFGQMNVDIPPVVLVHRYYYSGNRSFQGPMLPGGPSIIVVNHPQTGERCYIPAQMMPGAPRVTYTKHGIEYDYGRHGMSVAFGLLGKPTVKYRSGYTWSQKVAHVLHAEDISQHAEKSSEHLQDSWDRSKQMAKGAAVEVKDLTKSVAAPICNTLQVLPFGKMLFSSHVGDKLVQRAAQHDRDAANKRAQRQAERKETTLSTNR